MVSNRSKNRTYAGFIVGCVVATLGLSLASSSLATEILSLDFSSAYPPAGWTRFYSAASNGGSNSFTANGGQGIIYTKCADSGGPPAAGAGYWNCNTGSACTNYNFSFRHVTITAKSAPTSGTLYIFFNYQDSTHFDQFYYSKYLAQWGFVSTNGGTWHNIYGSGSGTLYGGELITLYRRPNSVQLYINAGMANTLTLTAGTQLHGSVGFGATSGQSTSEWNEWKIDDLLVDDTTPTPTATPNPTATPSPTRKRNFSNWNWWGIK
jgi:hypothetical protein